MKKKIEKIKVIINPAAGKKQPILSEINSSLQKSGIKWEALITQGSGDAAKFAESAIKKGIDALAVYGGDGTMRETISAMIGKEVPLAILPGGSANVLANELGIPWDLKEACDLLKKDPIKKKTIDVGHFDKNHFIARISLGLEADIVKSSERKTKKMFGSFAYALSALSAIKKTSKTVYDLTIDGKEHSIEGVMCFFSNAGNLGFSNTSFDKNIDIADGLLDILVVRLANISFFKLMAASLLKKKRPDNIELVEHWQGKNIRVSQSVQQSVHFDGEVLKKVPTNIKIIPQAIDIIVPD